MSDDAKLNLVVKFNAIDKLSGAMKNIIGLGRSGSTALGDLTRQARNLKGKMADVAHEMADATGNVSHLIDRERALAAQLGKVNDQIDRQKKLNADNAKVARITARGQQLKSSGQDNVVGGAAMATPLILAAKAGMEFSSGMVDIQQKANLSNRDTAAMADNILAAAHAAHQLPEDMRSGVDALAGLGLDPRQAVQMIAPIGRLGTAFKVDLADGANAAFANLNNLKVPIGQTTRALDIMAASGNAGAFEVKDMAKHFPSLTAQMQALGQKGTPAVADLAAALQIARRSTGDADTAANNVENLLSKINSKGTISAFKKNFGIDLPAALKKLYAEGKTPLEAIAELTQKATKGDLSKLGFAFEDMQAQGALRSLIQNMADYRKIRADAGKANGTINAAFSQREAQDASIAWKSLMGELQGTAIIVGSKLMPALLPVLQNVNATLAAVGSWAKQNPQLASTLLMVVAGMTAARVGLGVLQYAFGGLLSIVGPARAAFTVLRVAALFLARGVMQAGLMMLANPMVLAITAIVLAIGGAAYLIYTHWGSIKAAFTTGVAWVKGAVAGLPGWLRNIGAMMMTGLLSAISPMALAVRLVSVARNGITAFKSFLGIKSPSRLMMAMGGHMTSGLALGLDRNADGPLRSMARLAAGVAGAGALMMAGPALAGTEPALPSPMLAGINGPALGTRATPAPAPADSRAAPSAASTGPVTIHIHQLPGENARDLARRVTEELRGRRGGGGDYGDDA